MSLPPPVRRWRRRGFHVLVRTLAGSLRRLPKPVGRRFLRGLAGIASAVLPEERRIARSQLARALPDLAPARRDAVARASLRSLADNLLDMLRADAAVSFPDTDRAGFEEALQRGPVLALMAHAGAWELVGPVLVEVTGSFGQIVRRLTGNAFRHRKGRFAHGRYGDVHVGGVHRLADCSGQRFSGKQSANLTIAQIFTGW